MSDLTLNIKLTDAGLAAVAAAHGQGVAAKITHVAVGDQGYVPVASALGLHNELARVALTAGGAVAPQQVLLQGLIPAGGTEFFIRELAYFLEDGTCLGVWSDPVTPLGWIGGATPWFFKLAFSWSSLPAESITVLIADDAGQAGMALDLTRLEAKVRHTVEMGGGLAWSDLDETQLTAAILAMIAAHAPSPADATTEAKGIVRLATVAEAVARALATVAVTPAGLGAALDAAAPDLSPFARLAAAQVWVGQQTPSSQTLADAATVAWDVTAGQVAYLATTASRYITAPTGLTDRTIYVLEIETGGFSPSWHTIFDFDGYVPAGLSGRVAFQFRYDAVAGTLKCLGRYRG